MSSEVKSLTGVIQSIADIKSKSGNIAEDLKKNIADATEALEMTQQMSNQLRASVAELRGVLGSHSNHPPEGEDGVQADQIKSNK